MRNVTDIPENWVIFKITNNGNTYYKVFGSWAGGYLTGDSWKLNSGIASVEEDENYYFFYGYSGSCYQCRKDLYGILTSYSKGVVDTLIKTANMRGSNIEIMDKDTNWVKLLN